MILRSIIILLSPVFRSESCLSRTATHGPGLRIHPDHLRIANRCNSEGSFLPTVPRTCGWTPHHGGRSGALAPRPIMPPSLAGGPNSLWRAPYLYRPIPTGQTLNSASCLVLPQSGWPTIPKLGMSRHAGFPVHTRQLWSGKEPVFTTSVSSDGLGTR